MRKITITIIFLVIIVLSLGGTALYFFWNDLFFNPGERYSSDELNYMNVIYETRSDNYAFNEGYSESTECPWGFIHNGLDYFLINNSKVITAAPGKVEDISWKDNGVEKENRFHICVTICFNKTLVLVYNFEPWTQKPEDKDQQLAMIIVQKGEWVEIGQEIGRFLCFQESAHIHFEVDYKRQQTCPQPFFSSDGYNEIMTMIHSFHPTWELCYT